MFDAFMLLRSVSNVLKSSTVAAHKMWQFASAHVVVSEHVSMNVTARQGYDS